MISKKIIFLSIIFIITMRSSSVLSAETEKIYGLWHHSFEEEKDDYSIFRPDGYKLPRARAREMFEFFEDGRVIEYKIAPADGYQRIRGKFIIDNETNELIIQNSNTNQKTKYLILELTNDMLMLQQLSINN